MKLQYLLPAILLFQTPFSLLTQVKVGTGGFVTLGTVNNNQTNYVLIGTSTRYDSTKVSIDGYNYNGLAVHTNHTYDWGLNLIQKTNRVNTKCNIVDYNGAHNFYVLGNGFAYATGGYVTTSDSRLKTNLKLIESPLEKLKKITGYTYQWDKNYVRPSVIARGGVGTTDTATYVGLLAQDVQRVLPQAVVYDEDSLMGVIYQSLIPLLVEGIKQQQLQIDSLTLKVDSLTQINYKVLKSIITKRKNQNSYSEDSIIQIETPNLTIQNGLVLYQN